MSKSKIADLIRGRKIPKVELSIVCALQLLADAALAVRNAVDWDESEEEIGRRMDRLIEARLGVESAYAIFKAAK